MFICIIESKVSPRVSLEQEVCVCVCVIPQSCVFTQVWADQEKHIQVDIRVDVQMI